MNPVIKHITVRDAEYPRMLALRDDLLRKPLGMSVYNDDLSRDKEDLMLIAKDDQQVIGCVMMKPLNRQTAKLRQMAVAESEQGKGIGQLLVKAAEAATLAGGYQIIELNARKTAVPFYEKLGYKVEGPEFAEVGIPHFFMKKALHEGRT